MTTTRPALADVVADALGPLDRWHHQCHAASVHLVRDDAFRDMVRAEDPGEIARVARGTCRKVGGQHSWVVIGDPYRPRVIIDPTLWSYDEDVDGEPWFGTADDGRHRPHGAGSIWDWGCPTGNGGPEVELTPTEPLSSFATSFLALIRDSSGPLDRALWAQLLATAPVEGWPATEIIAAAADTEELTALVPIDRLGMLTRRNPSGLYLHPADARPSGE